PRRLYGDEVRVKQIITNLLTNAVKYTETGTVTLSLHYERLASDPDNILLQVRVKDTGAGIRPEDVDKLFAKFERWEEKRNRNVEGTGLGLSITENLLELMGSKLTVESVYGEGSTFGFALRQKVASWKPMGDYQAAAARHAAATKYHEKFTAPAARVLVVDDNPMNLLVFKSLVKRTRVQTDTAASGDAAIALAQKARYDLLFIDHMMPDKDGIETLQGIRGGAENPNARTPAICLTANAIAGAKEKYLAAGFDDYLTKPVDPDKLESTMLALLPPEIVSPREADAEEANPVPDGGLPDALAPLAGGPIDAAAGLKNNGGLAAYLEALKFFYETVDERLEELNRLYAGHDFTNYAIKVHALKSSARVIGAHDFGEAAQKLEDAGKAGDLDYVCAHVERFNDDYLGLKELLAGMFAPGAGQSERPKPPADAAMVKAFYEMAGAAARAMDCDRLDELFAEMDGYDLPPADAAKYAKLKAAGGLFDYGQMLALLDQQ
ncbi:MAG: response regulator, partial [Planctomycetes bacterium]|nr:response regulator [Planctomycetota bacterium]